MTWTIHISSYALSQDSKYCYIYEIIYRTLLVLIGSGFYSQGAFRSFSLVNWGYSRLCAPSGMLLYTHTLEHTPIRSLVCVFVGGVSYTSEWSLPGYRASYQQISTVT